MSTNKLKQGDVAIKPIGEKPQLFDQLIVSVRAGVTDLMKVELMNDADKRYDAARNVMNNCIDVIDAKIGGIDMLRPGFWIDLNKVEEDVSNSAGLSLKKRETVDKEIMERYEFMQGFIARDLWHALEKEDISDPEVRSLLLDAMPHSTTCLQNQKEALTDEKKDALNLQQAEAAEKLSNLPDTVKILSVLRKRLELLYIMDGYRDAFNKKKMDEGINVDEYAGSSDVDVDEDILLYVHALRDAGKELEENSPVSDFSSRGDTFPYSIRQTCAFFGVIDSYDDAKYNKAYAIFAKKK